MSKDLRSEQTMIARIFALQRLLVFCRLKLGIPIQKSKVDEDNNHHHFVVFVVVVDYYQGRHH
jgi:hypothetical protein